MTPVRTVVRGSDPDHQHTSAQLETLSFNRPAAGNNRLVLTLVVAKVRTSHRLFPYK